MTIAHHRPTKVVVNLMAIEDNVKNEIQRLESNQELFAVVKANGYGHGAVAVAEAAKEGGATGFCVATIDEGLELRAAGITEPILILGVVDVIDLLLVSENELSIPVATIEWLEQAKKFLEQQTIVKPIRVHIKVDTGMGRIGFLTPAEVLEALAMLQEEVYLWEGIFTHFATADAADDAYWNLQHQRFQAVLEVLPELPRYVHTSNSATALWHSKAVGNMIRYGVALYGLNPSGHTLVESYPLKPALELISALVQVKQLPKGSGIGYGETYITPTDEWIGTVPIGYADGWLRKMQGFSVLVEGEFCEIVGRVCMDQIMIRLPKEYPLGTKVTLIGENQQQSISMQEVADYQETIHYEVACLISERVPREYKR